MSAALGAAVRAALGAAMGPAVSAALQSYQLMCETHEFSSLLKPRFTDVMPRFALFLRILKSQA